MASLIDASAEVLRAEAPVFTRRNLYFAARRARGASLTEAAFGAALSRRLLRGALPGLLPERSGRRSRPLPSGWDAGFAKAVLLVDRPVIADLFAASGHDGGSRPQTPGAVSRADLAVVCIDGTPAPVVAWLARGFRAGHHAPVLYLHDAATVVYPFTLEPLATLVRHREGRPMVYRDLGLPPLGATARRFGNPSLPSDEPIFELEAIPPATLLRYCTKSVRSLLLPADVEANPVRGPA